MAPSACRAVLSRAARTAASNSAVVWAGNRTGEPGVATDTVRLACCCSTPAMSQTAKLPSPWPVPRTSRRSAASCSAASSPSSAVGPPISAPRRCRYDSTCSTPSCTARESRSRSEAAALNAAASARSRALTRTRDVVYPTVSPVSTSRKTFPKVTLVGSVRIHTSTVLSISAAARPPCQPHWIAQAMTGAATQ